MTIRETGGVPVIEPTDDQVDKLVEALLAEDEEKTEEAAA